MEKASHIGLWICVIGVGIFLTWSAVNKKSEDNTYKSGSIDNSKVINQYPLSMGFGCESLRPSGIPVTMRDKK